MKNYVVTNAYLNTKAFIELKTALKNAFEELGEKVEFLTNNAGGILGGISNGNEIFFRVAVKPVPSIFKEQQTVSVDENGKFHNENLKIEGRHDVCLCPRIVPVIEAMTVVTLCDLFLQNKAGRI